MTTYLKKKTWLSDLKKDENKLSRIVKKVVQKWKFFLAFFKLFSDHKIIKWRNYVNRANKIRCFMV